MPVGVNPAHLYDPREISNRWDETLPYNIRSTANRVAALVEGVPAIALPPTFLPLRTDNVGTTEGMILENGAHEWPMLSVALPPLLISDVLEALNHKSSPGIMAAADVDRLFANRWRDPHPLASWTTALRPFVKDDFLLDGVSAAHDTILARGVDRDKDQLVLAPVL